MGLAMTMGYWENIFVSIIIVVHSMQASTVILINIIMAANQRVPCFPTLEMYINTIWISCVVIWCILVRAVAMQIHRKADQKLVANLKMPLRKPAVGVCL